MTMRVSVAMATYNGEKYLKHQLESLVRQTRLPDELVVSDDASSDSTWAILRGFADQAPFPVHLQRNAMNLGVNKNFTQALLLCRGDLVFICDQDDEWFEEKIERTCQLFEQNPETLCIATDAYVCNERLEHGHTTVSATTGSRNGACCAFRKEFIEIALPVPDVATSYDGWLRQLSIWMGARKEVPEILQLWRRHEGAASGWKATALPASTIGRSKWYWSARYVRRLDYGKRQRLFQRSLVNLSTMGERLEHWLSSHPGGHPLFPRLSAFCSSIRLRTSLAEARMALLDMTRIRRLMLVSCWLVTRKYGRLYNVRDAMVDVLSGRRPARGGVASHHKGS